MASGTGQGDIEVRLLHVERTVFNGRLESVEARVAGIAQAQWLSTGGGPGGGVPAPVVRCATTSTVISAKSGGTAGSGSVVCSDIDPSSGAVTSAETLAVWNFFATSVPTSTDVFIGWAPNLALGGVQGVWVVTQRYCP